ncbi:MAG: molybdenum cofactor biosynthesis protein MoaE [Planctomycetota bacterium]
MEAPTIDITLHDGPLPEDRPTEADGAGASLTFVGRVRLLEQERELDALHYEAYDPMTTRQLNALARDIAAEHGLLAVSVWHSVGRVPVGAVSLRLTVQSPHRAEALRATAAFIDRMKRDVALWKRPVFADATVGAGARDDG